MSTHDDLRLIALGEFASAGYMGTSLQRIAELGGLSKSSVLYHYASKEALLEAALRPAVEAFALVLGRMSTTVQSAESRAAFIEDFVDCLLEYRLEIHIFINQSRALVDIPVIDRATEIIDNIAMSFLTPELTLEQKMRFGIALGGAAYTLASAPTSEFPAEPVGELKAALVSILGDLLDPVPVRSLATPTSPAETTAE
jgi:AcrR family transcriptional regulator